jgi:outer membrane receptor protein involved in Fe transport
MLLRILTPMTLPSLSMATRGALLGRCIVALTASMALTTSGLADTETAQDGLESVEVVAQRPPSNADFGASPLTVIDGETLAKSGAATLDEYLQRLPMFGFQGVNQNQNTGGYGVSFVDLRNLNFNRTLVLIDGRRVVLSGIKTDEAVDLANIPATLIDKIEIMPYGSAPAYGADAVAGVVNIVLKRDVTGFTWQAGSGVSTYGDAGDHSLSATYGTRWQGGQTLVSATWMHTDPLPQSARGWAQDPIENAAFGANGALILTRGSAATLAGHPVFAGAVSTQPMDGYDTADASYLRGGLQRATFNVVSDQEVTHAAKLFADLSYSDKVSKTQLPPQMLGLYGTDKNPDGFVIPAANPFNPYGQEVTLQRVLAEVGNLQTRSENQVVRIVVGIDGTVFSDTAWSLSVNHGESRSAYRTDNAVNLTRVLQTVSTDPAECPSSQGCVPADYFGSGSLTPAAADYIRYTDATRSEYLETEIQGSVSQELRVLPDVSWDLKLGAEYRREYGETVPSAVVLAGDQASPDSAPTSGGYSSREIFLKIDAPLLEDHAWSKSLALDTSSRYVSTTVFGDFAVWQVNGSWVPINDLRFRMGLGTARRVPAITEAFGGSTATALEVTDPCDGVNGLLSNPTVAANCRGLGLTSAFRQASALIAVDNGGNPNLKPESSRNLNAGAEMTPPFISHLTLDADYYRIRIRNAIDSLSDYDPSYIPDACFTSANLSSPLCRMITRTPTGPSAGQISQIQAPDANIGAIDTDGIDAGAHYRIDFGAARILHVDWTATLLLDYRVQETPTGAYIQEAGTFPNLASAGSLTRTRGFLATAYDAGPWTWEWSLRYIGPARVLGEDSSSPFARAPGIFYHDLSVELRSRGVDLALGMDNVANQKPPTLIDGVTNTNPNTYDVVGRYVYLRASGRW